MNSKSRSPSKKQPPRETLHAEILLQQQDSQNNEELSTAGLKRPLKTFLDKRQNCQRASIVVFDPIQHSYHVLKTRRHLRTCAPQSCRPLMLLTSKCTTRHSHNGCLCCGTAIIDIPCYS